MLGEIIDSKYRIDRQLGAGGMGNVYLATHLGTTRLVAVKVIAPKWAREPQFLARFQREAQACGKLRHPNIVNVTDFGIAKHGSADIPYLVMEYLDGETLSEYQKKNTSIPLTVTADLLDQVALALADAHKLGIVHRDLKPDNIWLEPNGRGGFTVKVLDFGVAKLSGASGWVASGMGGDDVPTLTNTGTLAQRTMLTDDVETVAAEGSSQTRAEDLDTVALAAAPSGSGSGLGSGSGSAFLDSSAGAQTMPGSLLGTPAYMSPEQAFGREIDYRSDIYSLAVVAYALVCGRLPFTGKPSDLFDYHESGSAPAPKDIRKVPADVSDAVMTGLARNPADRPASAVEFARRFHNAVDAEFLSLRRSKAFMLQHAGPSFGVMFRAFVVVIALTAIFGYVGFKVIHGPTGVAFAGTFVAAFLIFADNWLRAAATMIAVEEQRGTSRFVGLKSAWRLTRKLPALLKTQYFAAISIGRGWIVDDCLWPTICVAEGISGRAAIERSRQLMTGMGSAGRALAIRHLALPAFTIVDTIKRISLDLVTHTSDMTKFELAAVWFPVFVLFAAAPLFLYDRAAASASGPLLRLDRDPEVRLTTRTLSLSSIIWLGALVAYVLYGAFKTFYLGK